MTGQMSQAGQAGQAGPVIRPYGDTTGDGRVQLSFTLPVPFGTERGPRRSGHTSSVSKI